MANVFVFGSNLAGRHGKGAALYALQHYGAQYGEGIGRQGNSYAVPTKDYLLKVLTLDAIGRHLADFISYAKEHPEDTFMLTPIGTGLAGYSREQIYMLLKQLDVPSNVLFTKEWFNL
jgi:hypothetical protein